MFGSLDAFRAHCGEPTLRPEDCPICRLIPARCYREYVSSLVGDDEEGPGDDN